MERLLALLLCAAAACAPAGTAPGELGAVATVYPLAWVVAEVAPEAAVESLASRGQDPHDLELSPGQRALVESADVVAYLGDIGFQPQIEAALQDTSATLVDASAVAGNRLRTVSGHDDGEHGDAAVDPHLWFDALVMADIATAVGDAFATADPAGATGYRDRAAEVARELRGTAEDIAGLLSDCRHDEVVVGHEAYAYLLAPHDIAQHGISSASGHSAASPQDIAVLADEIRALGLPAVLTEPVEGRTDAQVVAREARVELVEIYSLDIVDDEQAAKGFPQLLREQAEAVARAAACSGSP